MNNTTKNGLIGTRTEQNLRDAAASEALSHVRYMIYSDIAKKAGEPEAARRFDEHAGHEKEHAELWLSYLDELSDTEENLDMAMRGETYEANEYYPDYSRIASEEGFYELADKFKMTADVERQHSAMLNGLAKAIADNELLSGNAETEWSCTNCGYHCHGNIPPERCPLCSYPKGYFSKK